MNFNFLTCHSWNKLCNFTSEWSCKHFCHEDLFLFLFNTSTPLFLHLWLEILPKTGSAAASEAPLCAVVTRRGDESTLYSSSTDTCVKKPSERHFYWLFLCKASWASQFLLHCFPSCYFYAFCLFLSFILFSILLHHFHLDTSFTQFFILQPDVWKIT